MMRVCLHMPVDAGFILCAQAADQMLKDGKAPADIHGNALYDQTIKGRFVGAQALARARARVALCVRAHSLDHAERDVRARNESYLGKQYVRSVAIMQRP